MHKSFIATMNKKWMEIICSECKNWLKHSQCFLSNILLMQILVQVLASPFQMSHLESKKHDIGLHQMSKWIHFRNVFANKLNKLWRRRRFTGIHSIYLVINEAFKYEYRHFKCLLALSTHDHTHTHVDFGLPTLFAIWKRSQCMSCSNDFYVIFIATKTGYIESKERLLLLARRFMCCWCKRNEQSNNVLL